MSSLAHSSTARGDKPTSDTPRMRQGPAQVSSAALAGRTPGNSCPRTLQVAYGSVQVLREREGTHKQAEGTGAEDVTAGELKRYVWRSGLDGESSS